MAEEWVELTGGEELKPDDVVRVWSKVIGAGPVPTGLEIEKICRGIESRDPRFRTEGYSYPDTEHRFFIKVRIVSATQAQLQKAGVLNVALISALVGSVVTLAVQNIMGTWTVHSMEKRVAGTATGLAGGVVSGLFSGVGGWIVAGVALYIAVKALGKK